MSSKEGICYHILRKYGILIDGPREVLSQVKKLPSLEENITFKQWKQNVFKRNDVEIDVYIPSQPAPQTRIDTLRREGGEEHIKRILKRYGRFKEKKRAEYLIERMSTFPKDTLISLLDKLEDNLEESVEEFFNRYIKSAEENIDTESLLGDLIKVYNGVVHSYRKLARLYEIESNTPHK